MHLSGRGETERRRKAKGIGGSKKRRGKKATRGREKTATTSRRGGKKENRRKEKGRGKKGIVFKLILVTLAKRNYSKLHDLTLHINCTER